MHPGGTMLRPLVSEPPTTAGQLPDGVPDAAAHPLVVYALVAAVVVRLLAPAVANAAESVTDVLTKRREHKQQTEDARIIDLDSQVQHLSGRIFTLEERQRKQDLYLYEHAVWDQHILDACIKAGIDLEGIGQPPPLRPPIDPP